MKINRDGHSYSWIEEYKGKRYGATEIYGGKSPEIFLKQFKKMAKQNWEEVKKSIDKKTL